MHVRGSKISTRSSWWRWPDASKRVLNKFWLSSKVGKHRYKHQFFLAKKVSILHVLNLTLSCCSYFLEKSHQVSWHERFRSQAEDELKLRMAKAAAGSLSFYSFLASLETGNLECFRILHGSNYNRNVKSQNLISPHSYKDLTASDLLIFLTSKTDQKGISIFHSSSGYFQGFIRLP